jgi:hypothetical protein
MKECQNIVTARMERRNEDHVEDGTEEVEEVLKRVGRRNCHSVARDWKEWGRILLEATAYNGL